MKYQTIISAQYCKDSVFVYKIGNNIITGGTAHVLRSIAMNFIPNENL